MNTSLATDYTEDGNREFVRLCWTGLSPVEETVLWEAWGDQSNPTVDGFEYHIAMDGLTKDL
jgi:hypothetical protein